MNGRGAPWGRLSRPQSHKRAREEDDDDRQDRHKRTKEFRTYSFLVYCFIDHVQPTKGTLDIDFYLEVSRHKNNTMSALLNAANDQIMYLYEQMPRDRVPGPGPLPLHSAKVTLLLQLPTESHHCLNQERVWDWVEVAVMDHGETDMAALIEAKYAAAGCEDNSNILVTLRVAYPGASFKDELRGVSDIDMADTGEGRVQNGLPASLDVDADGGDVAMDE